MTKEIDLILAAYRKIDFNRQKAALATVVLVEGSSYRRPGARMLITDDGNLTGAISGGCLEGDALRRARLVMHQGEPTIVTYDTTDEDDAALGVGLGCQGVIHILIEPLDAGDPHNPAELLRIARSERQSAVIVTLFSLSGKRGALPGTCGVYTQKSGFVFRGMPPGKVQQQVESDTLSAMETGSSIVNSYGEQGQFTGFIEFARPAIALVVLGAGNDVIPLTEMAYVLGWEVTVIDGRPAYAKAERFPLARRVVVARPAQVPDHCVPDARTFFVLMTHNYNYDLAALKELLNHRVTYIGVLGPRKKMQRMLLETGEHPNIYGPVGLDIGAEAAEEIALSIIAEIKMVDGKRNSGSLRELPVPIHAREIREAPIGHYQPTTL
ncbi:XdhC family protein [Hufsiella ginkgonis]|uniref:XdhC/CoxI family protein n=1 Tax=Hufsiella ginkgonis TaxID=2695274 RepID=A0A7K1XYJ8_9SPHI|nr:XdhC/CoxI family protein [Hufsiella ginkgonis]MXV16071.1 XdhC/CoxI family protein [Hufsiella ginkgonis]